MKKILFGSILLGLSSLLCAQQSQKTSTQGTDALYLQGKELFESQNYKGCITQLEKFVATANDANQLEEAEYMLAASAFETEEIESKEILNNFLKKYPYSVHTPRIGFLIGTTSFIRNRYSECIKELKSINPEAISTDEQQDYRYRLAYSYLSVDSAAQAKPIFTDLLHNGKKYADVSTYYLAWYDYKNGEFDKANEGFESVKTNPALSENARFYLTQINFIQKKWSIVIRDGEALYPKLKNGNNKAELARLLGESYYYENEPTKAIEYLTQYAEMDSAPLAGSMYLLGSSWFVKQDYAKAIQYLKFATVHPDELAQSAYYYLGCSYLKQGDKKNARLAFEIASTAEFNQKTKELSLYNYAMLIYETSYTGFNESITIFEQFLNLFPESKYAEKVSGYLTEVYLTSKNYSAALASIEKIKYPNSRILSAKQRILFQIGSQELINGQTENARKNLESAIALGERDGDSFADAHYWLGEIAFRAEKYNEAIGYLQSFLNSSSKTNKENVMMAYYNLGYAQFKTQSLAKAQNSFEKALAVGCKKNPMVTADILNRLGDCRYYQKDYAIAQNYYARAAQTSDVSADYSLFQQAQILSLQKQYNAEITLLNKIATDFAKSDFQDDALFEKAHTYQNMDKKDLAVAAYSDLIANYPNSSLTRSAAVQLGMLYLAMNNVEKSIEWYKFAITKYPNSDEANVANEDLKRVYKDQSRIGEYVQFLKTLNGKVVFSASEQDSLTYLGAEKNYMKGNKAAAAQNFASYLKDFPAGVFAVSANYYLAMLSMDDKKEADALRYFEAILAQPDNKFTETALSYSADLLMNSGEYDKAINRYLQLEQKTESGKKRTAIWGKLMKCYGASGKLNETIELCNRIIDEPKSDSELKAEARYFRAKANIALQKTDNLASDLTILAADTRNVRGAEAKFRLAEYYFKTENTKKAESEIFDYIDKGTPHQHWLARSFILLTDIYIKENDLFQAKQYLISLKNNYKEKDEEIDKMIAERLPKVQ